MAALIYWLNRCLPFTSPGTPLLQDLIHLAALAALLYFGPQLQERFSRTDASDLPRQEASRQAVHPEAHAEVQPINVQEEAIHVQPPGEAQGPIPNLAHREHQEIREEAGPAQPAAAHDHRNIGAKKAKALARKDQRRAYNEFLRSQGEAQRARDAEGAEEREEALGAEKERRRAAESAYEAKKAKERHERKQKEELSRQEQMRRRELAVDLVKEELDSKKCCDLFRVARQVGDDVDEEEIELVLKATGLLGKKGDSMTFVTKTGWVARVSAADMAAVYKMAVENGSQDEGGFVDTDTLAQLLDQQLRA